MSDSPKPTLPCAGDTLDSAIHQTSALLWLLSRCISRRDDPELVLAALRHFDLLAANPHADPQVRLLCARLAAQWRNETSGQPMACASTALVTRTVH